LLRSPKKKFTSLTRGHPQKSSSNVNPRNSNQQLGKVRFNSK
jgi:hypothetical protein